MENNLNTNIYSNIKRRAIINNKEPEFFSKYLINALYILNWIFTIFSIFSIVFYVLLNLFGKEFITNYDENTSIIWNLNKTFILIILILFGRISVSQKSLALFMLYLSCLIILNFDYLFNFLPFTNNQSYLSKNIFAFTSNIIFNTLILLTNLLLCFYSIYFYFHLIGYFKYNINELQISKIIHEIKLRTDMMKMNINSFMINMEIHKYFPNLLFKKEDFYFMNSGEIFEQTEDLGAETTKNNKNNISNYSDNMNSKSTIDCEYEPLN